MPGQKDIVVVRKEHIERGISAYKGTKDPDLEAMFLRSGQEVSIHRFNDGRILVVYTNNQHGLLYRTEDVLFSKVELS